MRKAKLTLKGVPDVTISLVCPICRKPMTQEDHDAFGCCKECDDEQSRPKDFETKRLKDVGV